MVRLRLVDPAGREVFLEGPEAFRMALQDRKILLDHPIPTLHVVRHPSFGRHPGSRPGLSPTGTDS